MFSKNIIFLIDILHNLSNLAYYNAFKLFTAKNNYFFFSNFLQLDYKPSKSNNFIQYQWQIRHNLKNTLFISCFRIRKYAFKIDLYSLIQLSFIMLLIDIFYIYLRQTKKKMMKIIDIFLYFYDLKN